MIFFSKRCDIILLRNQKLNYQVPETNTFLWMQYLKRQKEQKNNFSFSEPIAYLAYLERYH